MFTPYPRNLAPKIECLLERFPAVVILGARQVGKTTLAKDVGQNFLYVDLEKPSDYDRVTRDIEFFFKQNPRKVIFDEAQLCPSLFSVLRSVIDEHREEKCRFILTGSSSPELLKNISESLAGRVAILELGTLKANEFYHRPLSDFYSLFRQPIVKEEIILPSNPIDFADMQSMWFRGGYPEPCHNEDTFFYREWMEAYEKTYIHRDIAQLFPKLDKIAYRRFMTMLSELSSKIINKSDLARSLGISAPTVSAYLDIAAGTFLWRSLPSFEHNVTKRIVKMPRGHIRDTGLLHHLLHISSLEQLQSHSIAGFSFEAFVIEEILKGLQDARVAAEPYYYRTHGGAEIDLILEGAFGILPIEIKYGSTILGRQLHTMNEFLEEHQLPLGLMINQADSLEWLNNKVLQVPVGYL